MTKRTAIPPKLGLDEYAPFSRVARSLERGPGRAGYKPPIPGRTTKRHVLAWLGDHPEFRASHWLTKEKTQALIAARARPSV